MPEFAEVFPAEVLQDHLFPAMGPMELRKMSDTSKFLRGEVSTYVERIASNNQFVDLTGGAVTIETGSRFDLSSTLQRWQKSEIIVRGEASETDWVDRSFRVIARKGGDVAKRAEELSLMLYIVYDERFNFEIQAAIDDWIGQQRAAGAFTSTDPHAAVGTMRPDQIFNGMCDGSIRWLPQ